MKTGVRSVRDSIARTVSNRSADTTANQEMFTTPNMVAAGDDVVDLHEFRDEDDQSPTDCPSQTCFDVTIGP